MLDCIYTARMKLANAQEAVEAMKCAERFQIEELQVILSKYIEGELDTSNCIEILTAAVGLKSAKLRIAAMEVVVDNFYRVLYEDGFRLLPFELVSEVISCDKLVVRSGLIILQLSYVGACGG